VQRQNTIVLLEPSGVQLVVGHVPPEENSEKDGQDPRGQIQPSPRSNVVRVCLYTFDDPIGEKATQDLSNTVEAEPQSDSVILFFFGVPLQPSPLVITIRNIFFCSAAEHSFRVTTPRGHWCCCASLPELS
jgi:hypothetical protein